MMILTKSAAAAFTAAWLSMLAAVLCASHSLPFAGPLGLGGAALILGVFSLKPR